MIDKKITEKYEKELLELIQCQHRYSRTDFKIILGLIIDSLIIEGQRLQIKEELKSI